MSHRRNVDVNWLLGRENVPVQRRVRAQHRKPGLFRRVSTLVRDVLTEIENGLLK